MEEMKNSADGFGKRLPEFSLQRKRRAAIMIIDLSYIIEYSVKTDRADQPTIFDKSYSLVNRVVKKHLGKVDNIIGNYVVALFGIFGDINPELTACYCGREIVEEAREMFGLKESDPKRAIPIAVHSGDLYIYSHSTAKSTARKVVGENINAAFKTLSADNEYDITVTDSVYKKTKDYFNFKELSFRFKLGDKSEIATYGIAGFKNLYENVKKDAFIFGREKESKTLESFIYNDRKGEKTLVIQGEGNFEKRNILYKTLKTDNSDYILFQAIADKYSKNFPLQIFREIFDSLQNLLYSKEFSNSVKYEKHNSLLKEYFNATYYESEKRADKQIAFDSLKIILERLSQEKRIVVTIHNVESLDDDSLALLLYLRKLLSKSNVVFILTSKRNLGSNFGEVEYIRLDNYDYKNTKLFLDSLLGAPSDETNAKRIFEKTLGNQFYIYLLAGFVNKKMKIDPNFTIDSAPETPAGLVRVILDELSEDEKQIIITMSFLDINIKLDLLKSVYNKDNFCDVVKSLADKKLILINELNSQKIISFNSCCISGIINDLSKKEYGARINKKIAETMIKEYAHNISKYLEKIAYSFEEANDYVSAVKYYFLTGMKYRAMFDLQDARKYFEKAIKLAESAQKDSSEPLYFSDEELNSNDYIIFRPYFSYTVKYKISLRVVYYFYAKTFTFHERESLEYIEAAYNESKKYNDEYMTMLSGAHYFQYYLYMKKMPYVDIINEALAIAEKLREPFFKAYINLFFMDIVFSDSAQKDIIEYEIKERYDKVGKMLRSDPADLTPEHYRALNILYYSYYSYYLKIKGAKIEQIYRYILKTETFLKNYNEKMVFFHSVATGVGPLVDTKYQALYIKKALVVAKKTDRFREIAQYYSTLGYIYMIKQNYQKSLKYHKLSQKTSYKIDNLSELGMARRNLGDLYNCMGFYKKAIIEYKSCIKIKSAEIYEKEVIDFTNIIFPKTSMIFSLIKDNKIDEANKILRESELAMSKAFFGKEIPIFLDFLKKFISLIVNKYDRDTVDRMKNCYIDMKNIMPNAIQLIWMKKELAENGVEV
jgi:class 3 adenylate cyclase